jgi:hypothetical protein
VSTQVGVDFVCYCLTMGVGVKGPADKIDLELLPSKQKVCNRTLEVRYHRHCMGSAQI